MLRAAGVQAMEKTETAEARLKRMRMRSWRRGTKEMDLILGPYADSALARMSEADLLTYDVLLEENDQDLLRWILGQSAAPESLAVMIEKIGLSARARLSNR